MTHPAARSTPARPQDARNNVRTLDLGADLRQVPGRDKSNALMSAGYDFVVDKANKTTTMQRGCAAAELPDVMCLITDLQDANRAYRRD